MCTQKNLGTSPTTWLAMQSPCQARKEKPQEPEKQSWRKQFFCIGVSLPNWKVSTRVSEAFAQRFKQSGRSSTRRWLYPWRLWGTELKEGEIARKPILRTMAGLPEESIVEYCLELAVRGFPFNHTTLKFHVDSILQAQLGGNFPETGKLDELVSHLTQWPAWKVLEQLTWS